MIDLTKIDRPFGELGDATQGALLLAFHRWEPLQWKYVNGCEWLDFAREVHTFAGHMVIRVKPKPLTKPSVDWSAIKPEWKWLARDKDGGAFSFKDRPKNIGRFWMGELGFCDVSFLASYDPGTCPWDKSLVERPEGV